MNVQTQQLLNEIHTLKTKLLLYTNKTGGNMYISEYIKDLIATEDYFYQAGLFYTNAPPSSKDIYDIQNTINHIKDITSVLF